MAQEFKLGALCRTDKTHVTFNTVPDQWIVIVKVTADKKKADIEVFESEGDAQLRAAEVIGAGAGGATVPAATRVHMNVTKAQVKNITTLVESVMVPAAVPSPYHGKTAKDVVLPLFNASNGKFQGFTTTDAKIQHVGDEFHFVFMHNSNEVKVETTEENVKEVLGLSVAATFPVKVREALIGKDLFKAIKQCAGSKSLAAADELCAKEVEQVLIASKIVKSGDLDFTDADDRVHLAGSLMAIKEKAAKCTGMSGLTPQAIGELIGATSGAHKETLVVVHDADANGKTWLQIFDGVDMQPYQECKIFAELAKNEEEFRQFLRDSVKITTDATGEKLEWFQDSTKTQLGALERILRKVKEDIDLTGIGTKETMTCKQLRSELTNIKYALD